MAEDLPKLTQRLRPSPFLERESEWGATFTDDAGWRVPGSFEHEAAARKAARESVAIFDLSPTGRIKVTGKDRVGLLQRISTNDMRPLAAGRFAPTLFVTPKGRLVGRAIVFDRGESLLLLTSGAGRATLQEWIQKYVLADDFRMTDLSAESAAFALVGPRAAELVKEIAGVGVGRLEQGRSLDLPIEGVETLVAPYDPLPSAWMFLGEMPGIVAVYDHAMALGTQRGIWPIGTDSAEMLRVEAGIPAELHELTEDWNPWEARLETSFSLSKGCYTGQEVIARLNTYDKVQKRLVGVTLGPIDPPALPQSVYPATGDSVDREIGKLTSVVRSDRLGETIGLAFVRSAYIESGTELTVGEGRARATVRDLPFA